jgi:DNA-binding response OmpR family regulator
MRETASILVVDDHPVVLESLTMTLESVGHHVAPANDGEEALAMLESQPVDLILADIAMPGMNGYQLLSRVRENPAWVRIPFVFLSARALDSDVRYGKELGVDDYLTKPIDPEDLLAAVHGKLKRARQLAEASDQQARPPGAVERAISVGRLRIDPGEHRVWMEGEQIKLSAREFIVLKHLARRPGQVVPPQELIELTHDLDTNHVEAGMLLRPLVRSLRRKLGYPVGEMGCIETVRSVGYRLNPP